MSAKCQVCNGELTNIELQEYLSTHINKRDCIESLLAQRTELLAVCKKAVDALEWAGELIPDGVYFDNGPICAKLRTAIDQAQGESN